MLCPLPAPDGVLRITSVLDTILASDRPNNKSKSYVAKERNIKDEFALKIVFVYMRFYVLIAVKHV